MTRPSWDQFFLELARATARRATCDRKNIGVVLVQDRMILAGGYNGSLRGMLHCDEEGHLMEDGYCQRTVHAEANAVAQAARKGISLDGVMAYVTAFPCWTCFKLLVQAGVVRVCYEDAYRPDEKVKEACMAMGIALSQIRKEEEE